MAAKKVKVTFTRTTYAEAIITLPEDFDEAHDIYEDVAMDWLDDHADELNFSHDGCDIEFFGFNVIEA